jgi:hypothetical protein
MNAARAPHPGGNAKFEPSQQLIVYVLVALGAFVLGLLFGSTSPESQRSRVDWPQPVHPRRILP